ncbi:phosphoribosylglycinamide formyltransferase [Celerinatantimonas sp. YJH-8]|uniref:phosphoribosylglycinamide formyltransferase n=1 Tax=Celerinatantimonas sp. YJH-8 TaxID=3228714 RepID=UPI0038C73349
MKRIAVLISGYGSNLQAIIDGCHRQQIDGQIEVVVSSQHKAYGLTRAAEAGIDTAVLTRTDYPQRADYDEALRELLDDYQIDLIVLAGFMRILTPELVTHYQGRMLNIHPSLLPKYPGLNTHQRAIDANDPEHGCSIHFVTSELDGGPIILQAKVPVFADDDADSLAERVNQQELVNYPVVVQWFCQDRLCMHDGQAWLDEKPIGKHGYADDEE